MSIMLCGAFLSSAAQTVVNSNGIRYLIEDGKAIVGRQDKELSGDIVIPEKIDYNGTSYTVAGLVDPTNITEWSSKTVTCEGGAFQSSKVTSVVLPNSITVVSAGAFNGCSNLTKVCLPTQATQLGAACFAGCSNLASLEIPQTVSSFGSNSAYGFISYTFGGCSSLKSLDIPEKVTSIPAGCFMGAGIDSLFIHSNVTYLGENSLAMNGLKAVKMGIADIQKISYSQNTFSNISNTKLYVPKGSIRVYSQYEPWSSFASIQEYGEDGGIIINPEQVNVTIDNIKYILKGGVAIVGRQSTSLSGDIVIPENVTYAGAQFPVTSFIQPKDLTCYNGNSISIVNGAFQNTQITSIVIPASIKTIAAGAFYGCRQLKKVDLPEGLTQIGAAAFAGCYNLETIYIPSTVTDIASYTEYGYRSYTFGGCRSLVNVTIPKGVKTLATGCFKGSGIINLTIPSSVTTLEANSLDAASLKTLKLCVKDIDRLSFKSSTFGNVSKTNLIVPLGSKQVYQEFYPWMSFNSISEYDDGSEPFVPSKIIAHYNGIRYIIENGVATVARQNVELEGEVVIPEALEYNGETYNVTKIVSPTDIIARSSNETTTENGAFQNCQITSVVLPNSITVIPAGAFNGCHELTNVNLGNKVTQLGAACFAGCTSLEEIMLPSSITEFGSYTRYGQKSYIFGGCYNLHKVNIPDGVTKFTEGCFKGAGLETFIVSPNITQLEEDCFGTESLKYFKITHKDFNDLKYTESCFSNVSNTILLVPQGTKALYSEFYPWKNFKDIQEYSDENDELWYNAYKVSYVIDEENQAKKAHARLSPKDSDKNVVETSYIPSGIGITDMPTPEKEGYEFVGWANVPTSMPAKDIVLYARFNALTGINSIKANSASVIVYNLNGMKVAELVKDDIKNLPKGLYLINNKKIVVK